VALHIGLKLGDRYRLESRIGAGGMGEVWRAVDEVLGREVAVKAMLPTVADDPGFAKRFLVEAKAMASVNHSAVASIHDYGSSGTISFLVMEFIDGESVSQALAASGRLSPTRAMQLVAQAADGLQAVHERGIVHRDVKPANLLIRRNGSLVITDFGIARTPDGTQLTASGAILGTPTYLSPEQVLGRAATALSDVYSLGLTAYECLAGRRPFTGDNPYAVALQRLHGRPPELGDIPHPVRAVVERALAIDPADRWPSAAALADAARAAAQTSGAPALPPSSAVARQAEWARSVPPLPAPGRPASAEAAPVPIVSKPPARVFWRRRGAMIATAAFVALAGGVTAVKTLGAGQATASRPDPARASAAAVDAAVQKAGLSPCGPALCPTAPLCWDGVVSISGNARPPRQLDCTGQHAWETFAATQLPADAADVAQDELMKRWDIGDTCSSTVMASRSGDPKATEGWRRDAWPVQVSGTDVWIVHCIATSGRGTTSGSAFSAR
jgi:serine/threonine-protein kinase